MSTFPRIHDASTTSYGQLRNGITLMAVSSSPNDWSPRIGDRNIARREYTSLYIYIYTHSKTRSGRHTDRSTFLRIQSLRIECVLLSYSDCSYAGDSVSDSGKESEWASQLETQAMNSKSGFGSLTRVRCGLHSRAVVGSRPLALSSSAETLRSPLIPREASKIFRASSRSRIVH